MSNPESMHFKALNQIWKYLTYTWNYDLFYASKNLIDPICYCDADWGNDFNTQKSITNYIHLFWHTAITWKSSLQKTVALSSTKVKYMKFKEAVKESMFLNMFFQSIPFLKKYNAKQIWIDNESTRNLFKNPLFHKRIKHIDIQYYYVRECHTNGLINIQHISTNQQLANPLIKPVTTAKLEFFASLMGLSSVDD